MDGQEDHGPGLLKYEISWWEWFASAPLTDGYPVQIDYRKIFKNTVMIMALVKSIRKAPTMGTAKKARGAFP